jgi:hypothetical protein
MINWSDTAMYLSLTLGLGTILGTIIGAMVTKNYEKRKFVFEIKLDKYSRLIQAYQDAAAGGSTEILRQNYVSCQKQVELIGSDKVINLTKKMYHSKANESVGVRDLLVLAMREDLNI